MQNERDITSASTSSPCLITVFVKGARALDLFDHGRCDDRVIKNRRFAIDDFIVARPRDARPPSGAGDLPPMGQYGLLHPVEIIGITHMTHQVDITGFDGDRMAMAGQAVSVTISLLGYSDPLFVAYNHVSKATMKDVTLPAYACRIL